MDIRQLGASQVQPPATQPPPVQEAPKEPRESALDKVRDYFEARPDTGGDLKASSPWRSALGGGIQGLFVGGAPTAAGGALGGYAGTRLGEETGSVGKAITAGAVTGAGSTLLAASLIPMIMGGPAGMAVYLLAAGIIGAAAGTAGAVAGALKNRYKAHDAKSPDAAAMQNIRQETPSTLMGRVGDLGRRGWEKVKAAAKPLVEKYGARVASALAGAGIGAAAAAIGGPVGMGVGAIIGAVSGYSGTALAEKMQSTQAGTPLSAKLKGTALGTMLTASGAALMGAAALTLTATGPALPLILGSAALIGGLTGVAGTLSGSKLGAMRDGGTGGFMTGMLVKSFAGVGGPLAPLTASIGSAVGARASSNTGKAVTGALVGGALGAATGAFGGPIACAISGTVGAGLGAIGAVGGPKFHQGVRNLTADLQKKLGGGTDKVAEKFIDLLGRKAGLIVIGAIAGAIGSAPMGIMGGMLLGPIGAVAPSIVGGIAGAVKFGKIAEKIENVEGVEKTLAKAGPSLEDMRDYMCKAAFSQMEKSMGAAPREEKERRFEEFGRQTLDELKKAAPKIDEIRRLMSGGLFTELDAAYREQKATGPKEKFFEEKIAEARPVLTQIMVGELVARMSAGEEKAPEK